MVMQMLLPCKKADVPIQICRTRYTLRIFLASSREQSCSLKSPGRQQPQNAVAIHSPAQTGQLYQEKFNVTIARQQS